MSKTEIDDFAKSIIEKEEEKAIKKNGKYGVYVEKINYIADKYKSALFFIFLQLMVILILVFGYFTVKEHTVVEVVLPKVIKDTDYGKLKIGINSSNPLYYQVWGRYVSETLFNSNPKNIKKNIEDVKRMIYPEVLEKYSKPLIDFKEFIILNSASLNYQEVKSSIKILEDNSALFQTEGVLETKIGMYKSKKSFCKTSVKMMTSHYMLFITSFVKKCSPIEDERDGNVKK